MTWGFIFLFLAAIILALLMLLYINKRIAQQLHEIVIAQERLRGQAREQTIKQLGGIDLPPEYEVLAYNAGYGINATQEVRWEWRHPRQGSHSGFSSKYQAIGDAWMNYYQPSYSELNSHERIDK